jgi:CHAT domain-containing protein
VVTTDVGGMREAVRDGADLLYFLCHGRRMPGAGSAEPAMALDLGRGGRITAQDVAQWASLVPRVRWTDRRPLVVLNGCHTGERLPETLTDFASAFVESTGAAGVLATEVAMERRLACYLMDVFVAAWGEGRGVGAALRSMRWEMLRRGNVMGLAYSPYCDADLRLPRSERLPA